MKTLWTGSGSTMEKFFLWAILGAALVLFLSNLGNQYLWDDEAQTALISKTILTHYIPMGHDEKNSFIQEFGISYTKNYIWTWHPWLHFYVLAVFFKLFGISTFVARLPFALFGIASVFMTYIFCKALWQDRKVASVAAFLLLINVPFLILSRQCRYYSMTAFFSLTSLYFYLGLIEQKKYASIFFPLSLFLLFHTHYIYCGTILVAILFHCFIFHRNRFPAVLLLSAVVVIVNIPWILWLSSIRNRADIKGDIFDQKRLIEQSTTYLKQIFKHLFSPLLLLIIPPILAFKKKRAELFAMYDPLFWEKLSFLLFFILATISILIPASSQPFFRYLTPLVPIFAIITALVIVAAGRIHSVLAVGIVIFLILTGSLKNFLYEITHDYDGPVEGIVKFLNENGDKDDIVAITYGDMPLKFYTNMKVIGGLNDDDFELARQARWVIVRRQLAVEQYHKYFLSFLNPAEYDVIKIPYSDIPWENREEPDLHNFRTVVDSNNVVIFRKKK